MESLWVTLRTFLLRFEELHGRVAERIPKYSGDIANYTSVLQDAVKKVTDFYG